MIVPKALTLLVLGMVFYLGIILNLSLLQIEQSSYDFVHLVTIIILAFCLICGIILAGLKSKRPYLFYKDKILFGKKQILYQEIIATTIKKNFWDKWFKTYSLALSKNFTIKHIPAAINITDYVKKLVDYSNNGSNNRQVF